mmetsp:Transcript_8975/g.21877  ORF Transcript_8975/g.21877 Transcript_8975/m.21877 type:complete len:227 (-) Transcript_8975:306-986(-)
MLGDFEGFNFERIEPKSCFGIIEKVNATWMSIFTSMTCFARSIDKKILLHPSPPPSCHHESLSIVPPFYLNNFDLCSQCLHFLLELIGSFLLQIFLDDFGCRFNQFLSFFQPKSRDCSNLLDYLDFRLCVKANEFHIKRCLFFDGFFRFGTLCSVHRYGRTSRRPKFSWKNGSSQYLQNHSSKYIYLFFRKSHDAIVQALQFRRGQGNGTGCCVRISGNFFNSCVR